MGVGGCAWGSAGANDTQELVWKCLADPPLHGVEKNPGPSFREWAGDSPPRKENTRGLTGVSRAGGRGEKLLASAINDTHYDRTA